MPNDDPEWLRYKQELARPLRGGMKAHSPKIMDKMKGTYNVGDIVAWCGGYGRSTKIGVIILVVPRGRYPDTLMREHQMTEPPPKYKGYWRDQESYVVRDSIGGTWWPRAAQLRLVRRENDNQSSGRVVPSSTPI
jgi:hypothetical protein